MQYIMKIILNDYRNFIISYVPANDNIEKWYLENFGFIMKLIRSYIKDFGWAFGGASELYLDMDTLYKEHPYNLEDKYGEETKTVKPYYILSAA